MKARRSATPSRSFPSSEKGVGCGTRPLFQVALYGVMVLGAVGLFLLIRSYGAGLSAPERVASVSHGGSTAVQTPDILFHVLLALAAVLVAGRSVGALLGVLGQPAVIGEVVAGILLGPSLLGRIAPSASAYILPADVAPHLGLVALVGVAIYMFMVGLYLN